MSQTSWIGRSRQSGCRLTLRAYRAVASAAAPLAGTLLSHRLKRGKEHPDAAARADAARARWRVRRARWSGCTAPASARSQPSFRWSSASSAQDFNVLVTSGTVTSAKLAEQRLPPGVIHQFVPLDSPRFVARFLDHWRPEPRAVHRIRSVAEPDHDELGAPHSADPGQRPSCRSARSTAGGSRPP